MPLAAHPRQHIQLRETRNVSAEYDCGTLRDCGTLQDYENWPYWQHAASYGGCLKGSLLTGVSWEVPYYAGSNRCTALCIYTFTQLLTSSKFNLETLINLFVYMVSKLRISSLERGKMRKFETVLGSKT